MPGFLMSCIYLGLLLTVNHYDQWSAMSLGLGLLVITPFLAEWHQSRNSKRPIAIDMFICFLVILFSGTRVVYGHLRKPSFIYFLGSGNTGNAPSTQQTIVILTSIVLIIIGYWIYLRHHTKLLKKYKKIIYSAIIAAYAIIFGVKTWQHYSQEKKHDLTAVTIEQKQATQQIEGMKRKPNVIVVFMESVGVNHSKRYGVTNTGVMAQWDNLTHSAGAILTNAMSNGCTSDAGQYSLLYGQIPKTYINGKGFYNTESVKNSSIATIFNDAGYDTQFISTAPMSFLGQRGFIEKADFGTIIDEKDFADKPQYTFDAAPDKYLYDNIIYQTHHHDKPYMIVAPTISTHKPFSTPYGNTQEDAYRYADEELGKFIVSLESDGFFENGILIMMGDHRNYDEMTEKEKEKRGESAYGKIAAGIIAPAYIKPGTMIDKNIQQIDIYHTLKQLISTGSYEAPLFNNPLTATYARPWSVRFCNRIENRNYISHPHFEGFTDNIENPTLNKRLDIVQ